MAWEPLLSSESDMTRVDCTSSELDLEEHSFVPNYFGVSTDFHAIVLEFACLVEVEPNDVVDWEALEVRVADDTP